MEWLPLFFAAAMGFALFMYIILDGYDLGIGMLIPFANDEEKDLMISTIGPFWDANETWIVLGVGIMLMAFPFAHSMVLTSLYLPVAIMLLGLILRGVSFDFRVKAKTDHKKLWNNLFSIGSLIASMAQGWMLGNYVMGLTHSSLSMFFTLAITIMLPVLYIMMGCGWLLYKTEGDVYWKAVRWARIAVLPLGLGLLLISIATPLVSETIAAKWFRLPEAIGLMPIPLASMIAYGAIIGVLSSKSMLNNDKGWIVYVALIAICIMCGIGLGYSLYPDIVIDKLTIWEAASSKDAMQFAFYGTVIAVPCIFAYTIFIYRVFRGKTTELSYESDR
ncbi:MAG: cytochrome BD ubiquinol oxidase subunit II [Gammaproteobacteria bacterium]|nr:cytochrome BD ubiquinol oxidase subunit II [Gammaproteobacteria bacterium]HBF07186.1 cytochrome BD ubiquinol oxidase subunit II [Gammaproteobacteria bacterium]|tara:strand:- start:337 stop:1335 length:999 start_codon:yes stop_codon:yes gene_type:complete